MTKRHKKAEIQERRRKVAMLYLQRMNQEDIARALGISQPTVSRDLQAIEKQWRKEAMRAIEEVKARELAELDAMEREAALQYQKTKSLKWFNARLKVKERRARLLGLEVQTVNVQGTIGPPVIREVIVNIPAQPPDIPLPDGKGKEDTGA